MIIAVIYASTAVAKRKPEKYSGLNGIQTHDLCDTGAVLYQLSCQANWELVNVEHCTILLKGILRIHTLTSSQLAWLAQLVEHCTGIAEVMGLNPVQA